MALPLLLTAALCAAPVTVNLTVDARDAARRVIHAHLSIPAAEGPLVLRAPKWNPGAHAPASPLNDLVGLRLSAGGKPLPWRRAPLDPYAFTVEVPKGARTVEVDLDQVMTPPQHDSEGAMATHALVLLNFWPLVLVPDGADGAQWAVRLTLPQGYRWASALTRTQEHDGEVQFAPVPLATLIDSPVLAGRHFKVLPLSKGERPVDVAIAGDSEESLAVPAATVKAWEKLVAEADALFGARHFSRYRFLVALTDALPDDGLEHHECSENRISERGLLDDDVRLYFDTLLPHELVHSWNGKYRRPVGLATPNPQAPIDGTLLWVYEGLTEYLGTVLSARSGLSSADEVRDTLASSFAALDATSGRRWRPLADTAVAAPVLYGASSQWSLERRGTDFYSEGALLWLEVDARLRTLTHGERSLDDFCRAFFGGKSGPAEVVPYQLADVLAALGALAPFDWKGFFAARVDELAAHPPRGLEASGWKLVFDDQRNAYDRASDDYLRHHSLLTTLGLLMGEDGAVLDVSTAMPAARAGLSPGLKLIGVNGRRYTPEGLRLAVAASGPASRPLELLVEDGDFFRTFQVEYRGGTREPHLGRVEGSADLLSAILAPGAR